ncbi:hypothetical protein [Amycolatopsis vastitatis]|uniref:Uncharacterized protein n=1 Tax=Amycolatopsis vastitatis TaxID=1905142 RepID=A0A229SVH9_9PSEU|nr:hypothetical protein [Amycolatopsis vastitatis]OXM63137.1 hypothetical protein CF165_32800 [Amycolatopsis vastitatis]
MKTLSPRVWGTAALACSGGAQVLAGMAGNLLWQLAFLLLTVLSLSVSGWMASPTLQKIP